jgi:hypothetical protein
MTVKETRLKSGYSQTRAAALVPCSPNSWRLFEANPDALRPELRKACESALEKLAAMAEGKAA